MCVLINMSAYDKVILEIKRIHISIDIRLRIISPTISCINVIYI